MRKKTRKKILPRVSIKIASIHLWGGVAALCGLLTLALIFFTSPENTFFFILFFISLHILMVSIMQLINVELLLSILVASGVVAILVLRSMQMANIINVLLIGLIVAIFYLQFSKKNAPK